MGLPGNDENRQEGTPSHCGREGDRAPITFYAIYYQSDYAFTGSVQTFTAPVSGWYKVQLWGAKGGNDVCKGGNGGYTQGEIKLDAGQFVYVYVGAPGKNGTHGSGAGWNGGGNSGASAGGQSGSGGGATDIRLIDGAWNNYASLSSRILVAGGGGGGGCRSAGGVGGGLSGGYGKYAGGTQTSAGPRGGFGYGGSSTVDGGGGGGGWYGGGASTGGSCGSSKNDHGGGGGSSYIGSFGTAVVRNAFTKSGNETMPVYGSSETSVGNAGPCHASITLLERY